MKDLSERLTDGYGARGAAGGATGLPGGSVRVVRPLVGAVAGGYRGRGANDCLNTKLTDTGVLCCR